MGIIGWYVVYLLSDVFVVFGVGLGRKVFIRVAGGFAGLGFAICSAIMYKGWRRTVAFCLIPVVILLSALQVNAAYGQYPTIREILGTQHFPHATHFAPATTTVKDYVIKAKAGDIKIPQHGHIRNVSIPATHSRFRARQAAVYLPPAALTQHVPALPVLMLLSGQPGSPDTFFTAGQMGRIADQYAARHHGLAPIIISPDQLGNRFQNTLCADTTKYGKAQTYLMKDVVSWMKKKLPVSTDHTQWGIGGFSQGGTCSIQLGPAYPQIFHYVIDVAGEDGPHSGSQQNMIDNFFGGSKEDYEKQTPRRTFAAHPYQGQRIVFAAGQLDTLGQRNCVQVSGFARQAGWSIQSVLVAGSAHDWTTVRAVMDYALADFGSLNDLGLPVDFSTYKNLSHIPGLESTPENTPRHHAHHNKHSEE
ncbi:alpha/beta hydrolase [Alloscardovia omnicolens]|uniref:alpha/beta hydrolase n=1 Tax=Alloscardovia omnicolens TaxID=419015 RepID=UPI003A77BD80